MVILPQTENQKYRIKKKFEDGDKKVILKPILAYFTNFWVKKFWQNQHTVRLNFHDHLPSLTEYEKQIKWLIFEVILGYFVSV